MSDTKFTPGPWDCERKLDPNDLAAPWVGRLAEQRYTALSCGQDVAERMANAHLIAAAPALFEAVEALVECFIKRGPWDEPLGESEQAPSINAGVAAIKQARGEA